MSDYTESITHEAANEEQERGTLSTPYGVRRETMTIADRVRTARIAANKTQQQLAGETYSKSYISAVERGKMTPSVQALGILAERLGLPVSYFLGESDMDLSNLAETSAAQRTSPERERQQREEAARLTLDQAEGYLRQGQHDEAWEALNGSSGEPLEDLPLLERPRWYLLAGWAAIMKQWQKDAIPLLERGLNLAETLRGQSAPNQRPHLAELGERIRDLIGGAYYEQSQPEMALEYHRKGQIAISEGVVSDPELKLRIYKSLGNDYLALGRHNEAIAFYQEASKLAEDMDDPRQRGLMYWGLAIAYQNNGDLIRARINFPKALAVFESFDNMQMVSQLRSMFGQVLIQLKDYEEAEKNLRQSLGAAERTGDSRTRGAALANFASLHLAKGDVDKAVKMAHDGLKVVKESGDRRIEGQLYLTLAEAHQAKKDLPATEKAYKDAIATFEKTQDREFIGRAHERYGQFLADQGQFQAAYQHMQQARAVLTKRTQDL
jgi:tetratricopeptide (TPR) repeat protein